MATRTTALPKPNVIKLSSGLVRGQNHHDCENEEWGLVLPDTTRPSPPQTSERLKNTKTPAVALVGLGGGAGQDWPVGALFFSPSLYVCLSLSVTQFVFPRPI
ncbi:hypothetical protein Ddc_01456 [Ditylenchus destructor]|nr:hypothetical protein Ddc_01456 [Ditylenchus destructor]